MSQKVIFHLPETASKEFCWKEGVGGGRVVDQNSEGNYEIELFHKTQYRTQKVKNKLSGPKNDAKTPTQAVNI